MSFRSTIKRCTFTAEPRLRTPIRIGIAVIATVLVTIGGRRLGQWLDSFVGGIASVFVVGTLRLLLFLGLAVVLIRYVDHRRLTQYGIWPRDTAWWRDLAVGVVMAAGLVVAIAIVELAGGWARLTGVATTVSATAFVAVYPLAGVPPFGRALLAAGFLMVVTGVTEELGFRGYLLPNLEAGFRFFTDRYATPAAAIATALPFAIAHVLNPNVTVVGTLATFLAGVWLATAYVLTGRLGLPIGLHIGWNLVLGAGVGLPVSGVSFPATVVDLEATGPRYLTGGAYGPEGGLVGLLAVLGGLGLVWWYATPVRGRGRGEPVGEELETD